MTLFEEFIATGFGWRKHPGKPSSLNSQKCYRNHISQFENFLAKRGKSASDSIPRTANGEFDLARIAVAVNDEDIDDYIAELKAKYAVNTVAVKVAAVKSYFKWLKKKGKLTHLPTIRSQRSIIPEKVHVNDSDINAIIQHLEGDTAKSNRDRAMLSLIALCGFKTEEVVTINKKDVDFQAGTIKGQSMTPAMAYVAKYAALRSSGKIAWKPMQENMAAEEPFFLNKHGRRLSSRSLRRHLSAYRKKVGLPQFTTRDLRHTWVAKQTPKEDPKVVV